MHGVIMKFKYDVFSLSIFFPSRLEALVLAHVSESHSKQGRFLKIFMYIFGT